MTDEAVARLVLLYLASLALIVIGVGMLSSAAFAILAAGVGLMVLTIFCLCQTIA